MVDFTHNPIIPADYKSRGRGLPYEASPSEALLVSGAGLEPARPFKIGTSTSS